LTGPYLCNCVPPLPVTLGWRRIFAPRERQIEQSNGGCLGDLILTVLCPALATIKDARASVPPPAKKVRVHEQLRPVSSSCCWTVSRPCNLHRRPSLAAKTEDTPSATLDRLLPAHKSQNAPYGVVYISTNSLRIRNSSQTVPGALKYSESPAIFSFPQSEHST
jgi:hypothetical protein